MNTKQKIFCGVWVFAIIASAQAATTTSGITNKASRFSDVLSDMGATTTDSSNSELAETIRRQRALLDAQADKASAGGTSNITTANACDAGLRKCMTEKCGADFTKCAKDSTTVWGNKMDACRRNTKCTGHEYTLLAPEILADRNATIELSYYNSVVNCGNKYNNCIFGICGKTLDKCLSKSAGDSAIAKCKSIADECREQDSGIAGRVSGIFGDMRTVATADAQKQEKRLYELRDLMRTQCTRLGAIFDERTLDCVYTVNFFAGEDHTLMASKKLYSGDTFQCTPDWFGVDITTYMENAQRLTRSQKGASAAAMGAGLGTAAGLISSNAIGRAIDTQNAEKQAKEACENDGGEWVSAGFNQGKTCDMSKAIEKCKNESGTWNDKTGCLDENGQPIDLSNGGGRNPGEISNPYYSSVSDPESATETTNVIGKPCGNENAGTWISCNDAFCGKKCYDNKKDEQVSCACVNNACLKNGRLRNHYTILNEEGKPVPLATLKCKKGPIDISNLKNMTYDFTIKSLDAPYDYDTSDQSDFDGDFCFDKDIPDDNNCIAQSIGLNSMVGTMKELKEALKNNDNKLIMCSSNISLSMSDPFGSKCDTLQFVRFWPEGSHTTHLTLKSCAVDCGKNIKVTEETYDTYDTIYMFSPSLANGTKCNATCPGYKPYTFTTKSDTKTHQASYYLTANTGQKPTSKEETSTTTDCASYCQSFEPSNDILAITPPKITYVKASSKCISSPACTTKIQNKCNELKDTEYNVINVKYKTSANFYYGCDYQLSQSQKDCSAICDKLVLTDLHLQRQQLSDISCKNACTSIIQKACNELVGTNWNGHRIIETELTWDGDSYGCKSKLVHPGRDETSSMDPKKK